MCIICSGDVCAYVCVCKHNACMQMREREASQVHDVSFLLSSASCSLYYYYNVCITEMQ